MPHGDERMKVENGMLVEITERELYNMYLTNEYDDIMTFREFARQVELGGCVITQKEATRGENG